MNQITGLAGSEVVHGWIADDLMHPASAAAADTRLREFPDTDLWNGDVYD